MDTHAVVVGDAHVAVSAVGEVSFAEIVRAERMIGQVLLRHHIHEPARVRLVERPGAGLMTVQANVRTGRGDVRTQIDGSGGWALTFAAERLDHQLRRVERSVARRMPDRRRAVLAGVSDDRPVTRRKTVEVRSCDPAEAIATMDAMDYDAHLFTDAETGEDAVVYWAGPRGVRFARQWRPRPPRDMDELSMTMNPHRVPVLAEHQAAARLCRYGLPFLFCTDTADRRGRLLYRRYDGDVGVVIAR
ncbi:sigma 54 modulation/S30EA ribosomal C-terminal domain-containing protein [Nocardia sp. CC227C]|uniref:sigma 54 modulation/S30EA ribosomal C-terminal domain-containing protein n=1 Tax=Nocardia sp. CC227C TaxID=3044562 RepID=UPI00278C05E6|nr:sigma 54 modulation/S30EA ribosomal C-terminal domain-containing protein [Nocardia sp. CC227C]